MEETIIISDKSQALIKKYLPDNATIADMCTFFSIFCDVTRVRIITALCICEMCVNDIAIVLNLNQTTVSHQLKILRDSGMVKYRRNGKIIFYSASNKYIEDVMSAGSAYLGLNEQNNVAEK